MNDYFTKDQSGMYSCTLCGKQTKDRSNMKKHIENIHFPGSFSYQCKYCDKVFTTRNNLNHHVNNLHKEYKFWGNKTYHFH